MNSVNWRSKESGIDSDMSQSFCSDSFKRLFLAWPYADDRRT